MKLQASHAEGGDATAGKLQVQPAATAAAGAHGGSGGGDGGCCGGGCR